MSGLEALRSECDGLGNIDRDCPSGERAHLAEGGNCAETAERIAIRYS